MTQPLRSPANYHLVWEPRHTPFGRAEASDVVARDVVVGSLGLGVSTATPWGSRSPAGR